MQEPILLQACRRQPTPYTPVWLMRQAGRYMPEYRALREKVPFLTLCKTPDLAAQVTVEAVQRLGVDAAIIFADILLIVEPMGVGLEFSKSDGPIIHRPVRSGADVDRLSERSPLETVPFVFDAVRKARAGLPPEVPLIGFSGAPFTVASYLIEGGSSRHYIETKRFMYQDAGAWRALMERLVRVIAAYVNGQIAAGAQVIQLFDSWVGCLSPADYRTFILPYMQTLIQSLTPGTLVIHFGTETAGLLELLAEAGGDVIGVDWRIDLDVAWHRIGENRAVQGNLDPVALFAPRVELRRQVERILQAVAGRPGHIFNLGHGILPQTPVENVMALVEMVHEMSEKQVSGFKFQVSS
ncbi:MAG TPA: uroporphyrinogen decarboxylase [Candidatus Binatia bacterium]|nr:uroporphyrinogen decarboxylase [Candidatus Binatia bacterium]